jgi:hypothetical protein
MRFSRRLARQDRHLSNRQLVGLALALRKRRHWRGREEGEGEPAPVTPTSPRGLEGGAAVPLTFETD